MARTKPYPSEYRQQIIELARAGRSAYELSQEFEPSYWTIHQWINRLTQRRADALLRGGHDGGRRVGPGELRSIDESRGRLLIDT